MTLLSRRVVSVFIASFLIAALVLTAVATAPMVAGAGGDRADRRFENLTAVHIGGGALASQVTGRLEDAKGHVVRSARIPEALGLDRATVVVFGDEWFEQRVDDAELHDFLRLASSQGAGMVMAGGATSEFFEALHDRM